MGYIFDKFTEGILIAFDAVINLLDMIAIESNKEHQGGNKE